MTIHDDHDLSEHGLAPARPEAEVQPLDPGTVLRQRPRPEVEWVDVDGELVAWHQESESLHLLDQVASLVFLLADGENSLSTTIADLADGFGQDRATVEPAVLAFAAELTSIGLVEVVR